MKVAAVQGQTCQCCHGATCELHGDKMNETIERDMIVKDDNTLVAFVNSQQPPIKTRHICYYATPALESDKINLCEVFEATYPHPQAPQDAVIPVTDCRIVKTVRRQDYQAAHIVLMEAQQKACRTIEVRQ